MPIAGYSNRVPVARPKGGPSHERDLALSLSRGLAPGGLQVLPRAGGSVPGRHVGEASPRGQLVDTSDCPVEQSNGLALGSLRLSSQEELSTANYSAFSLP
jgi:hypothetical protein